MFIKLVIPFLVIALCLNKTTGQVDYSLYGKILSQYVSPAGQVNYENIVQNQKEELGQFLRDLADVNPENLKKDQQLAYWINAYNAFTIQLIIDHWPVKSIKDIANGEPWDKQWITLHGGTYSLNQIEHDIIRPGFNDPRIHFAVNCAAKSCPPLLNKPYYGDQLDHQLNNQSRLFINNPKYNRLSKKNIEISRLFEWYEKDFDDVIDFINKYSKITIDPEAEIRYKGYNWALNN